MTKKNAYKNFSPKIILSVLALVATLGSYGGYVVYKENEVSDYVPKENLHTVTRIVDGDTFEIDGEEIIRLLLVDTPEIDECYGLEAKNELQKLTLGKQVLLQKDSTSIDKNGRLLRYVFLHSPGPREDNIFINDELVKTGFAKFVSEPRDKLFQNVLSFSYAQAKKERSGVHKNCPEVSDTLIQENKSCNIKGNNSRNEYGKKYFPAECITYNSVKMDKSLGDEWFCSEQEAKNKGYTKAKDCL